MGFKQGSNALDSSSSPPRASSALLSEAKDFAADRDRPFAEFPLSEANGLRVTRCDRSNGQVQFVQIEPCLKQIPRIPVGASAKRIGARLNTSRTPPIYRPQYAST